ncbi:HAMP domain-containing protein [Acidovorax sp. DW039]|uniref:sensor histidine kinase n=1 Tax=Acidovorax sp. DW039 TaxID=3095606 RepID=UPI003085D57F|nr:HAMP domain-containing protein [Acidovorax sp. DW039]
MKPLRSSFLGRIWVRFGLHIAGTLLVTMALLTGSVMVFSEIQQRDFHRSLPAEVRAELEELEARGEEEGPRAMAIYAEYWRGDVWFSEKWSLALGLLICLPIGLGVGFFVSRVISLPLASMAEAATKVAAGDFTMRAQPMHNKGEMAEMVHHFNQMIDALEKTARERKATTASISHELRTPLAVLQARLHAICDGVIQVDAAESRLLLDQVEHLGRLVADLQTLSMAEAGYLSLQLEPLDLVEMVREDMASYANRLEQHHMALELALPSAPHFAVIKADRGRMRQILFNLLENALRHAKQGRWLGVEVLLDTAVNEVVLSVSDAGPGMSAALLAEPFQRFPHAPGHSGEGLGLGLSIVRALTERQGGSVQVRNREEGGTCFTLRFPAAEIVRA